ncbi:MAG: hypothetical protein O3A25_17045 [Acidobacteria bacterium]|nr:hypothetical protein [Acidobacteriota bacterium]
MDKARQSGHVTDALIERGLPHTDGGVDCPDPSLLAGLHEGGLEPDETKQWMTHLAGCRRCQATLGALARAEEAARPDPALAGDWWRALRRLLRWPVLAPLVTGAVVVVAVWVLPDTGGDRSTTPAASRTDVAADSAVTTADALSGRLSSESGEPLLAETRSGLGGGNEESGTPNQAPPRQLATQAPAAARAAVRLDPVGARPEDSVAAMASPDVDTLASVDTLAVAGDAASPFVAQGAVAPAGAVLVPSPEAAIQWRAGVDGTVARTDDGGLNWRVQLAIPERVVAGTAPAASIAWLVGEEGLVLRTVDGERWTRIPPPEDTSLVAVDAADGLRATVTTTDQRQFQTDDAGTTWTPVR